MLGPLPPPLLLLEEEPLLVELLEVDDELVVEVEPVEELLVDELLVDEVLVDEVLVDVLEDDPDELLETCAYAVDDMAHNRTRNFTAVNLL